MRSSRMWQSHAWCRNTWGLRNADPKSLSLGRALGWDLVPENSISLGAPALSCHVGSERVRERQPGGRAWNHLLAPSSERAGQVGDKSCPGLSWELHLLCRCWWNRKVANEGTSFPGLSVRWIFGELTERAGGVSLLQRNRQLELSLRRDEGLLYWESDLGANPSTVPS